MSHMIDKKNEVTFLISSLGGGGAEGVCVTVANGLAARGWDVQLVVLHENDSVYHERLSNDVSLIVLGVDNARYAFFPLFRYLRSAKVKKIVVFNYELTVLAQLVRSLTLLDFALIARNTNTFSKNNANSSSLFHRCIAKPLIHNLYSKADHVINQCDGMMQDLLSVFPELNKKASVIYNPVNSLIEEASFSSKIKSLVSCEYILCIGRLESQKAFHRAIKAFAAISISLPKLRLKIVGQGSQMESLRALTVKLGVSDRVDFEGFQSNIIDYYLNAKLTLLTSLYEGFPNVLIESITLGTPVVSIDCESGPREIIRSKINGELVQSEIELPQALLRVLLCEHYKKNIIKKTSIAYSHEVILNEYEKTLAKRL